MGIFGKLFGGKAKPKATHDTPPIEPLMETIEKLNVAAGEVSKEASQGGGFLQSGPVKKVVPVDFEEETTPKKTEDTVAVNIWDLDDATSSDDSQPETAASVISKPVEQATAAPARRRRTKTRLIGFNKEDGQVVDLFDNKATVAQTPAVRFPVGWFVITEGPGRGACFSLITGMSQIGRGDDQTIQLDFGDSAISRSNHAAVVYDPETHQFLLGHGGKKNLVRVNGSPLVSNEVLKDGDQIRLGETTLRFIALCNKEFNWETPDAGENEDVEIA